MNASIVKKFGHLAMIGFALGALGGGCAQAPTTLSKPHSSKPGDTGDPNSPENQAGNAVGDSTNTYDHFNGLGENNPGPDPLAIAQQRAEEGPPEIRTRMHSCQKLQVSMLHNILTDLGVDLSQKASNGQPPTAGDLLNGGGTALGQANYASRMGEALVWTAAGAAKQFDIFVQAAPDIIANLASAPACGVPIFNADNSCNKDGISCLIGKPATDAHVAICNNVVTSASGVDKGKAIAVATILSAAHSCE